MRTIEGLGAAPKMQDRKPKTLVAQEFHTTIIGLLGQDLRQYLQVIQGTYALLRSRRCRSRHGWTEESVPQLI